MGLRSDHQAGRSWRRRGEAPVVPGTEQRFRCNMISALTHRGRVPFMIFKDRFTANGAILTAVTAEAEPFFYAMRNWGKTFTGALIERVTMQPM